MAVNLCGTYDEVFKFKEWGSVDAHKMLLVETLEHIADAESRGRVIESITYDSSNHQYYAFRISYV